MDKISGIYKITNIQNGFCYIGQAINLNDRKRRHFRDLKNNKHKNPYLQNAYNKYGEENFEFNIIQELENNEKLLNLMETYWIVYFDSFIDNDHGYNLTWGGDCSHPSKQTIIKLSESHMGNVPSESTRKKLSITSTGRLHTEDAKQKISIANSGSSNGMFDIGINHPMFGKFHTEESKQKMSASLKGRVPTDETREKLSNANKGKKLRLGTAHSKETKEKMSASHKLRYAKIKQEKENLTTKGE